MHGTWSCAASRSRCKAKASRSRPIEANGIGRRRVDRVSTSRHDGRRATAIRLKIKVDTTLNYVAMEIGLTRCGRYSRIESRSWLGKFCKWNCQLSSSPLLLSPLSLSLSLSLLDIVLLVQCVQSKGINGTTSISSSRAERRLFFCAIDNTRIMTPLSLTTRE